MESIEAIFGSAIDFAGLTPMASRRIYECERFNVNILECEKSTKITSTAVSFYDTQVLPHEKNNFT